MRAAKHLSLVALAAALAVAPGAFAQDAQKVQIGNGQKEFPESVTSTSDGTLFAGSLTGGTIYRAAAGSEAAELWIEAPAEGPKAVLGVYADEANNTLWACYADLALFSGAAAAPSILRSYDIGSGELKSAVTFPDTSFCNDIATTADGTAYAADTATPRILKIAPGATTAETWVEDPAIAGADGLSFGKDGALYVNSVTANKLFRVDVGADGAAGKVTELKVSEPLQGADGMRFGDNGKLYLAENGANRISEITIDGDNATVKALEGPAMVAPTAVTLVGNTLWALEAKISLLGGEEDPGQFWVHPIALSE